MVLRMRTLLLTGLLSLGIVQAADVPPATNLLQLQRQLQKAVSSSRSPTAAWGIQINAQQSRATWFATNASSRFIPASNTKLFTAALSLDRLGADYRLVTSLRAARKPDSNGTLPGDLRVVGGGDPTLCARLHQGNWEAAFAPLVEAVRAAGIRRIQGNLVCDESRFRSSRYGSGWAWDDLSADYGAAVSALTAEDNCVNVVVIPGTRAGDPAQVQLSPLPAGLTLVSRVVTGPTNATRNLNLHRWPGEKTLQVSGTVPADSARVIEEASVPEPARWFGELFREALRRQGIDFTGQVTVVSASDPSPLPGEDPPGLELGSLSSPPIGEVVREMMKPSQNLYAQLLLLAAGTEAERYPREDEDSSAPPAPTSEEAGTRALRQFLKKNGFAPDEVVIEEGSGLSRKNLVTPRAVIQLLELMPTHRWGTAWMNSFPVGGQDGTLRRRFPEPPTRGNVRAKTGTLRYVTSLSGYLTNAVGEPLIFSVLVNNYLPSNPGDTARAEIDQLIELLAQSRVKSNRTEGGMRQGSDHSPRRLPKFDPPDHH